MHGWGNSPRQVVTHEAVVMPRNADDPVALVTEGIVGRPYGRLAGWPYRVCQLYSSGTR